MALRDNRLALRSSLKQVTASSRYIRSLQSELEALHGQHFPVVVTAK